MKNVLYLSYTGMTDPLGQSQVLAYLGQLSKSGEYVFTIISFEKKQAYQRNADRVRTFCKETGIKWHPLQYTKKPPVLATFIDVWRMRRLAMTIYKDTHFDIVHCRSYIPSLVGLRLKKKKRTPYLFDMRGFWADERLDGNIWRRSNPIFSFIYKYFKKKEKQFLLSADHIVSLTQHAKDEILSWKLADEPLKITVIPCCADTSHFDPESISQQDKKKIKLELTIPEAYSVLTYVGSLGTWYMLDEMLNFFKQFNKARPDTIFLILTGEPESVVKEAAARLGLDEKVVRIKRVEREAMPLYISLSDYSLFFIKPAYSKKASSPVKQGELMAMGIPVICNKGIGDTDRIVEKYQAGVVLPDFSEASYDKAISMCDGAKFDRIRIRSGALEFFSLEKGVEKYANVYKSITSEQ